ncbi:MAG: MarR family transcriptional regulator [Vulcanisaeta sp.]|nr:MarR family transcriptional regulator [Vulcanisaeta sp.]MCG2869132.1 MarR family transcriptional regulator [Vulcanisaeta sp.]MCG2885250.1 MarR family transcriptional regulator [Vulcanisaeta sp.]
MAITYPYYYYVMVTVALIQLATLSSLLYQVIKESRRHVEGGQSPVKSLELSYVNQLEFDMPSRNPQITVSTESSESIRVIDEDEVKVLAFLLSRGGETYQAEIARELGLPKSTVSRIIRRLYEKGLITVRRVGRFSYVRITDVDYVNELINRSRRG